MTVFTNEPAFLAPPTLSLEDCATQIARWFVGMHNTAALLTGATALVFADPSSLDQARSHVFACSMPPREFRLSPGLSIVVGPSPAPQGPTDQVVRIGLIVECRVPRLRDATALLGELRDFLRPYGATVMDPARGNLLGAPLSSSLAPGETRRVWRVLWADIQAEPQPLNLTNEPNSTEEGEAMAQMRVVIACIPAVITGETP